jgi:serine/threonine protein kinase/Tol biopolymer transport system component
MGGYRIVAPLGAGGMGEVWRAEDEKLGREVALKVLPADFASDPERLARFEREAKVLASLNHPNIATLYGLETVTPHPAAGTAAPQESAASPEAVAGHASRVPGGGGGSQGPPEKNSKLTSIANVGEVTFLVMELVEGEDLSELLKRGAVPLDEATAIARQIADALEAAHEAGIVHRDLKPANIKITDDGVVKVLDFGLAKAWESEGVDSSLSLSPTVTRHATAAGVILGTAAYMSPEQARGKKVDRRADIWSYGVVLWEMLSGNKLFEGETVSDVLAAVLTRDFDLDALPPDTTVPIKRLLTRCLAREPRNRLQWIGDARLDLVEPIDECEASLADVPTHSASKIVPWAIAAVLTVVAAIAVIVALKPSVPDGRVIQFAIHPPEGTVFHLEALGPGPLALSPDGNKVAFSVRDEDGVIRLCVRRFDSLETQIFAGTEGAQYPFWSPDSREVGFFTNTGAALRVIPADGGPVRTLCISRNGKGGSWNTNGTIVFTPNSNTPIFAVSSEGGEPRQLTEIDPSRGENSHRHPWFLPDGRHFLYTARSVRGGDANTVVVGSLDGEAPIEIIRSRVGVQYVAGNLFYLRGTTLFARPFDPESLDFLSDEIEIADGMMIIGGASKSVFSATPDVLAFQRGEHETLSELVWLDRKGNRLGMLGDVASYYSLAVSPDGSRVAVPVADNTVGTHDLWIYDVERDLRSRVTFDDSEELTPVWSPDGREVYFSSNRGGPYAVYRLVPEESSEPELVIESEQPLFAVAISPDGSQLIVSGTSVSTGSDLMLLDLREKSELEVFRATKFNEEHATFSPDGRWVAYTSDESGRFEVYIARASGGGRHRQVSTDGGFWPRWTAGTSEVIFQDLTGQFVAVTVQTDGSEVEIGTPDVLFGGLPSTRLYQHFDLPRDGSRILFRALSNESPPDPPTVVLNWMGRGGSR